jgi:Proline racemase
MTLERHWNESGRRLTPLGQQLSLQEPARAYRYFRKATPNLSREGKKLSIFLIERFGPRPGGFAAPRALLSDLINRIQYHLHRETRRACSGRMAALSVRGLMKESDVYRARSIIGSEFVCRIARRAQIRCRPFSR